MSTYLPIRPRRLRHKSAIRQLIQETQLQSHNFVLPIFLKAGKQIQQPIKSMPGHYQWSLDTLPTLIEPLLNKGLTAVILFGIPAYKDSQGSAGKSAQGVVQEGVRLLKLLAPHLLIIADVCLCEYTNHGHCGVPDPNAEIPTVDNDLTLIELGEQAISLAQAGADILAPSGMMDGMVGHIRQQLDASNFKETPILSYAVKYASALYGPFREAAEGAPRWGDRRGYQMDPANANESLREAELDIKEGADMLMVKPASLYLDVIHRVKTTYPSLPLGAYQVSGEYTQIKAAAQLGWINEKEVALESVLSIKRAGADFIISYFTASILDWLHQP